MKRQFVTEGDILQESGYDASTGQLSITVIKPGWSKNNRYYSAEMLKKCAGIFEGCKMFADHATDKEAAARPEGSVKDWVASVGKVNVEADGSLTAKAQVIDPPFRAKLDALKSAGMLNQMGVSIRAYGTGETGEVAGKKGKIVESLIGARSVDFVTFAGAGGQVDAIESAANETDVDVIDEATLRQRRPDLIELIESNKEKDIMEKITEGAYCPPMTSEDHAGKASSFQAKADELKAGEKKDANQAAADAHGKAADAIKGAHKASALAGLQEESAVENKDAQLLKEANEKIAALESATKKTVAQTELTKLMSEAKLPKASQDIITKQFAEATSVDGMKEVVEAHAELVKSLKVVVKNNGAPEAIVTVNESEVKTADFKKRQYNAYIAGGDSPEVATRLSGYTPTKQ